ncbi:hypothetical protein COCOBI_11-0830 [Coccomyxa sp. Obi]|nr:hypothetical protein COCOBI_11-0830 [Coccomyxa sp. Obi]
MQLQEHIPASLIATVRKSRSTGDLVTFKEDLAPPGLSNGMEEALAHVFPEESSEGEDVSGSSGQTEETSINAAFSLSAEALDYRWETESVDTDCQSFEDARSDISEPLC